MVTIKKVLNALSQIIEPQQNKNIVSLGLVRNIEIAGREVSFTIHLPQADTAVIQKAQSIVKNIEGVSHVNIQTPQIKNSQKDNSKALPDALTQVKAIIAISSCKGGVGKSTLAAHIAQELANRGLKTGLVDTDIYGPSIPTLFNLKSPAVYTNDRKQLLPIEKNNLKIMSFGFLLGDSPAIMRGPIVTRYIQQILLNTDWGELDYLILDLPPGTGDVHLTITQSIRLSGAIIVTTPHTLSLIDVARGILMFEKVRVPILGVIENMSYFQSEGSDKKHYLFGSHASQTLQKKFGIQTLAEIPILPQLTASLTSTQSPPIIKEAVDQFLNAYQTKKDQQKQIPSITCDDKNITLQWGDGRKLIISNFTLRLNSQDAFSVDEMSGKSLLKPEDIRKDIAAKKIIPLGNYAINIEWNDGHTAGIYPYQLIESLAK